MPTVTQLLPCHLFQVTGQHPHWCFHLSHLLHFPHHHLSANTVFPKLQIQYLHLKHLLTPTPHWACFPFSIRFPWDVGIISPLYIWGTETAATKGHKRPVIRPMCHKTGTPKPKSQLMKLYPESPRYPLSAHPNPICPRNVRHFLAVAADVVQPISRQLIIPSDNR